MTNRPLPRSTLTESAVDDGWGADDFGPPGTTIPPDYLGARNLGADGDASSIPVEVAETKSGPVDADDASAPTEQANQTNGESKRAKRTSAAPDAGDSALLTDTVKGLNQTDDRNAVFELLMEFLSATHGRVAFFAVKKGRVCAWKHKDLSNADDSAEVALDESTTFHSVVEGQAPYHGSDLDSAAQAFLSKATGAEPEEIFAAPVAIGPRVIGVLYGDAPHGTVFDQQVSMVTQTAGLALQRILQAAKKK